ncbi:MAG: TetR/AcrR family transcriptional regulator [Actinomycetia bacterium]|nr:TetR/AcrR family transcriptional regulator [Actinomycetes bacterium]
MSATTSQVDDGAVGGGAAQGAGGAPDGRSRRWEKHRATRRQELVDATLRAIRAHGATVGMDDIASTAATSKTVFYRHFSDRAGLYAAVCERVDRNIMRDVSAATDPAGDAQRDGRTIIGAAIHAYLRLVEDEPEIYRFIVAAPILDRAAAGDPSAPVSAHIAEQIAVLLEQTLGAGRGLSRIWSRGIVGMVRAVADDWLTSGAASSGIPRDTLADHLTDLAWGGLSTAWSDEPAQEGP